MSVRPSAPASSHARAIDTISVTLGLSLINTGFVVTAFTARVTSAADSADVPKAIPPLCTLGQETLTSMMPTCSSLSILAQHSQYSSNEKPLILAMIGLWKRWRKAGNSRSITLSIPGFCKPTEFIIPELHSAIRGVGLPKRASRVVPLKEIEPRISRSYTADISSPKPNVPLAGITGLSNPTPHNVVDKSFTIISPPS